MSNKYTQGVCEDGAAILFAGEQITVDQIIARLNAFYEMEKELLDSPYVLVEDHEDVQIITEAVCKALEIAREALR